MKLGQALVEQKNLKNRIDVLQKRLVDGLLFVSGETPKIDAGATLSEIDNLIHQRRVIVSRINRTNSTSEVPGEGITITEAIALRDAIHSHVQLYASIIKVANNAGTTRPRYEGEAPITTVSQVSLSKARSDHDKLAREYNELDALIQSANWTIDLK